MTLGALLPERRCLSMAGRTAIGSGDDDLGRILAIIAAVGTMAALVTALRRFWS